MDILKTALSYFKTLFKWLIVSTIVGLAGGLVGSAFHICVDLATETRTANPWIIWFLPLGGVLITALYNIFKFKGKLDTNRVLDAAREDEKVPLVMAPLIFISTVITHLFGGSAGREGAALQLGGSLGYNIARLFRLGKDDIHIIVMSGMSGVFSALFGTPLAAAFFSLEVIRVGIIHYAGIVPCVISASTAYLVTKIFGVIPVRFENVVFESLGVSLVIKVIVLALLCAFVSILFCKTIKKTESVFEKFISNPYLRAFVGGGLILGLTYLVGSYEYNGAGMDIISRAINGEARYEAFLLKILFTAITIAAGFKGGEIVPTFFIGSTFGCVAGSLLGLNPGFAASIGFIALFCGVVNCPITSILLSIEIFGSEGALLFAIATGISYMMSGYFGLYKSQKIAYSKLNESYININTH